MHSDAEIEQSNDVAFTKADVGWLDVAVHDAHRVRTGQAARHLHRDHPQLVRRDLAATYPITQRAAGAKCHHDTETTVGGGFNGMDGTHVGILET